MDGIKKDSDQQIRCIQSHWLSNWQRVANADHRHRLGSQGLETVGNMD